MDVTLTFKAGTLRELEQQILAFVCKTITGGEQPAATAADRAVPEWAPPGSRWVDMPGAPALVDADGAPVPVRWGADGPQPGQFTHYDDPAAEAAGAALLKSISGQ